MQDFRLRCASPADLDAIMALENAGFPSGIREQRATFAARLRIFPAGFLLLIDRCDNVVAYCCAERRPFQENIDPAALAMNHDISTSHDANGTEVYISSLTLHPDFRGGGLGARFFSAALAELEALPGIDSILLLVNAEWQAARRIYQHCGFTVFASASAFFQPENAPAQDALLMRRFLPRP